jgi:hypothetical protein
VVFNVIIFEKRGSLLVEAAFVYPILILLVAGMVSWGADLYNTVHVDVIHKLENREESMTDGTMDKKEAEWIRGIDAVAEGLQ